MDLSGSTAVSGSAPFETGGSVPGDMEDTEPEGSKPGDDL